MRGKSRCRSLLAEIQPCSVRALAYQLFNRRLIPSMAKTEVQRVSRILVGAREDGEIDWSWIVDETQSVEQKSTWDDPAAFARTVTHAYAKDKWTAQPNRVEVWSEKGTVRGTLKPILDQYEVAFRVMHGWAHATTIHDVSDLIDDDDRSLTIIYVGDWDPSGLYMSAMDIPQRLERYSNTGNDFDILRLALTEDDLESLREFNFDAATKSKDSRYRWFVANHGNRCCEVDALNPNVLRDRVEAAIVNLIDQEMWDRYVRAEEVEQASIRRTVKRWSRLRAPIVDDDDEE